MVRCLLVLALAIAGCDPVTKPCSSTGRDAQVPPIAALPAPIAEMRAQIAAAAADCDFDRLEQLALPGEFHYDYDVDGDHQLHPADFWRKKEAAGEKLLLTMVEALRAPYRVVMAADGKTPLTYIWPGDDQSAGMSAFYRAGGLGGWHLFLAANGDWAGFDYGD
ncbi:MAG: hypothetical protein JWM80_502 [Cyanobacteria bacterium RYN_339]|nr:hypothetical protein [Cyanobacteria bacterium RYN_339]